ncbi:undecaprenyl-diphosphatase [Candidatus Endobugula sertula]|uniref:Undecaprenyl-diphosphatase n=1 Tax=Candidatus Endobugula sertula TaxID=62101 RepID=A0A1D2QQ46_9GAMM|nr:undecaprenyl-diphosphatase [Candidatus Endobugula sertula]
METLHIIVLAVIQGVTEFLPISSSGHLILPNGLLGWPKQGLTFDVAVHVGTLVAVVTYFRQDIMAMTYAWCLSAFKQQHSDNSRIAWYVILATIPAGLGGLLFNDFIETNLRTTVVIAITTILFGVLLGWSDRSAIVKEKELASLTVKIVFIIGVAQALALIPGTSRSGITITAALLCGFQRDAAARFSFLMSIPIITLSGGYKALQLVNVADVSGSDMALGALVAAASAFLCIHYFLKFINNIGMMPFVVYRLLLGGFLLFWGLG